MSGQNKAPDPATWQEVLTFFDQLVELPDDQQQDFITELQVSDEVRDWLQKLLDGDRQENAVIDQPIEDIAGALLESDASQSDSGISEENWIGKHLGAYRVVEELGRGGMSLVMLADRADGRFEKQVALKLIKSDAQNVITEERLDEETRILARLQHPNIAYLLDAGISEQGTTYTAMEYCPGVSLTEHCQQQALCIKDRLRLMQTICRAVHYAHQNLVVHRDLKPSNILVQPDGTPKLVDFGIASVLDKSGIQGFGLMLLTPEYAAPEQFSADSEIGTGADVYALGVLLYELLTGLRPFKYKRSDLTALQQAKAGNNYNLPSEQVAAGELALKADGIRNKTNLAGRLRGDLDAIVQRAMAGDAAQRYPSAQALADDIQNYLQKQPVSARSGGKGYRFGLWLRRNKLAAAAYAGIFASLSLGLVVALWQAQVARTSAARAEASQSFLVDIFEAANPILNQRQPLTANELMAEGVRKIDGALNDQPLVKSDILNLMGDIQRYLGNFEQSTALHEQSLKILQDIGADAEDLVEPYRGIYLSYANTGDYEQTKRLGDKLVQLAPIEQGVTEASVLARFSYSGNLLYFNEFDEAEAYMRETLSYRPQIERLDDAELLLGLQFIRLGQTLRHLNKLDEAVAVAQEAQQLLSMPGVSKPTDLAAAINLEARIHQDAGDHEKSLGLYQESLALYQSSYSDDHPSILGGRSDMSTALSQLGRHTEALDYLYENLPHYIQLYGEHGLNTAVLQGNIALGEFGLRNFPQAVRHYQLAIEAQVADGRERDWRVGVHRAGLADSLAELGEHQSAREEYLTAIDVLEESIGSEHRLTLWINAYLAYHYYQTSEFEIGSQLLDQVGPGLLGQFDEGSRQHGYVTMLMGLFAVQNGNAQQGLEWLREAQDILAQAPGAQARYASQLEVVDNVIAQFGT